jgi:hypothetical protein
MIIIRKIRDTTLWPSVKAVEAEVKWTADGETNTCVIPAAKFAFDLYVQNHKVDKEFLKIIDDYLDETYSRGVDSVDEI